jgi:hypothetical protein
MAITFYNHVHETITLICKNAGLGQNCISSAMFYFHKYFIFKKCFKDEEEFYTVCIACIFIATKYTDELISIMSLIKYANQPVTSENVFLYEFEILEMFGFNVNITLAYKYLHLVKPYLDGLHRKLFQLCYFYINDSYKLPICLYFEPHVIALACIYLFYMNFKIELVNTRDGKEWYRQIDDNVDLKQVVSLSQILNKIYKFESGQKNFFGVNIIKFVSSETSNEFSQS